MLGHLVSQNGIFGIRNLRGQKPRGFVWPIQGCSCCQGLQTRANLKMSCSSAICSNAIPADQVKLDVYSPLHVGLGLFPGVLRRRWLSAQRWTKCCEPHNVRGPPTSAACVIPTRALVFGQFCCSALQYHPKMVEKNTLWNHLAFVLKMGRPTAWPVWMVLLASKQLQLDIRFTWSLYISSTNMLLGLWLWNLEPHLKTGS